MLGNARIVVRKTILVLRQIEAGVFLASPDNLAGGKTRHAETTLLSTGAGTEFDFAGAGSAAAHYA